jgi:hypothetical protein
MHDNTYEPKTAETTYNLELREHKTFITLGYYPEPLVL